MSRRRTVAVAIGGLLALVAAERGFGAGTNAGAVTIIDPATAAAKSSGGSTTVWSLKLPASPGDRCSGDSANNGYFVYSYLTPVANDPGALTFDPTSGPSQPAGSFAYPLFDTSGSAYNGKTTAPNTGQVKDFPGTQFDFARFSIDARTDTISLPAGTYNLGIVCWKATSAGAPAAQDKFWNSTITFAAAAADPAGETWTAAAATTTTTTAAAGATTTTTTATGATTTTTRASGATTTTTTATGATTTTTLGSGATTTTTRSSSVAAASSSNPGLPRSGRSIGPQLLLAGFLLYMGALILAAVRRRHWALKAMASRR